MRPRSTHGHAYTRNPPLVTPANVSKKEVAGTHTIPTIGVALPVMMTMMWKTFFVFLVYGVYPSIAPQHYECLSSRRGSGV